MKLYSFSSILIRTSYRGGATWPRIWSIYNLKNDMQRWSFFDAPEVAAVKQAGRNILAGAFIEFLDEEDGRIIDVAVDQARKIPACCVEAQANILTAALNVLDCRGHAGRFQGTHLLAEPKSRSV